jgi:flagellar protein FlaG
MSAETITTAIFLITAVVATAVLVNAIYPVIYTTAGTFQASTHDADTRLRTDFKIVANFAYSPTADVYMKNIGSQRISLTEIHTANVFCGSIAGNLLAYDDVSTTGSWTADIIPPPAPAVGDDYWDTGETLHIKAYPAGTAGGISPGGPVYFQFVLPSGIWRSNEFTAS